MRIYYDFIPAPEVSSDRVTGMAVYDILGKPIGRIRRLLIDKGSGRVSSVQVSIGGFLGLGAHRHTIPWDHVSYDGELDGYRAAPEEQLGPEVPHPWAA